MHEERCEAVWRHREGPGVVDATADLHLCAAVGCIQVKEAPEDEKIAASGMNVGRVVITIMEEHLVKHGGLAIPSPFW